MGDYPRDHRRVRCRVAGRVALVWVMPWYGLMSGFIIIGLIAIWLSVVYDLIRRADMPLWQKMLWAMVVVLIPVFGVIAYFLTRPSPTQIRYHGDIIA